MLTDLPNRDVALLRRLAARSDREIDQALELFAEVMRERDALRAQVEALRESRTKGGRKPFGEKPDEREQVEEILRLIGAGHSYGKVARQLNEAGRRTQTGKEWRAQQVKNVVENECPPCPVVEVGERAVPPTARNG